MSLPPDIKRERQIWFWRRVTLQTSVLAFQAMLAYSVIITASLKNDWSTLSLQLGLIAAIVFLTTIYFASVNDSAKIDRFVGSLGKAIGDARDKDEDTKPKD